jgi:predicted ArsR family transcriptional regulator
VKQSLIEQVGRSARLRVLNELKRSQGLSVTDIAERVKMSYMGVKGICLDLEKRGLLDTWRHPQKIGRPRMLYRLTHRAHELFPETSNAMTIDLLKTAQKLFGATAPEKLLLVLFQQKGELYTARVRGETIAERAEALAKLRDQEGCMAELEEGERDELRIVEHHSPMLDLLRAFPIIARLECEIFQRVLGPPVRREESTASGLFCATFFIGG